MLMGDIPDVSRYAEFMNFMKPYFHLIKAVGQGKLELFNQVLSENKNTFVKDKNFNLVQKLRHVVIKVGLRKINLSYNRISLADICQKLNLNSILETEYIVGKVLNFLILGNSRRRILR